MANTRRRVLSVLMALVLTLGLLPTAALAGGGASGSSEAKVEYAGGTRTSSDGLVTVSKTASHVSGNNFEITLTVKVKDSVNIIPAQPSHVVLVIDQSNSMSGRPEKSAQEAAAAFADVMLDTGHADGNKIAVVGYGETATTKTGLTDNLSNVKRAIQQTNSYYTGTNIQAGIHQAQEILRKGHQNGVKDVILILSDGEPTYSFQAIGTATWVGCEENWWTDWHDWNDGRFGGGHIDESTVEITGFNYNAVVGNGGSYEFGRYATNASLTVTCEHNKETTVDYRYYENNGDPTIVEADYAKSAGTEIYSVYLGNNNIAKQVMQEIASGSDYAITTSDVDDLAAIFKGIANEIPTETNVGKVEDPMGTYIKLGSVSGLTGVEETATGLEWTLSDCSYTTEGEYRVYTVTYPVTLDTSADDFVSNTPYPTNDTTTFHYSVNGDQRSVDFDIPRVSGVKEYKVVYAWADGAEKPAGVNLNELAQTGLSSLASVEVAALPTAEGYTIGGWYTNKDGTGDLVVPGTGIDLSGYAEGNTVTLYATSELKGDLQVVKELTSVNGTAYDGTSKVKVGDELTYTITVTNTGYKTLNSIVVSDTLGTGLEYESSNPTGTASGKEISWTIASLGKDESAGYTVTATVQASASGSSVKNTATATCETLGDDATVTTPVEPALEVTKEADQTTVTKGDKVVYTITVTNNTNVVLTGVEVTDGLPTGLKYVSAEPEPDEGTTDTWTIASLPCAAGSNTWTVKVTAEVTTNEAGPIENTATAIVTLDNEELTGSDKETITVTSTGKLTVTKVFNYDETPDDDAVTENIPKNFAATLELTNQEGETYKAPYEDGQFVFDKIPYGKYTVKEEITYGDSISGTKKGQAGTLSYDHCDPTEITVDEPNETATITNYYTFTASDQVIVRYVWGDEGASHSDVTGKITLPAEETLTVDSDAQKSYTLKSFTASNLPDGYTVDTGNWYTDAACTKVATNDDVRNAAGGTTVTLYAKLSYSNPKYQICYAYYYASDLSESEAQDRDNYDYTGFNYVDMSFALSEGTAYTVENVFQAVTGSQFHKEQVTGTGDAENYDGLYFTKWNTTESAVIRDEVSVDGLQANGRYQYTVKVYVNEALNGKLTVTKSFSGVEALPDDFQITVEYTDQIETAAIVPVERNVTLTTNAGTSAVAFTYDRANKTYTWVLPQNIAYGTEITVTESNYAVDGYNLNSRINGTAGVSDVVTFTQANSTVNVVNAYSGQAYRVIFLAGDHGVMNISYNSTATEDSYTRFVWMYLNEEYKWSVDQSGTGVVQSNLAAHYDFNQSQLDAAEGKITVLNAPGVTADRNWDFDGFYLVQEDVMRDVAYSDLAGVMALFDELNVQAGEDGVKTLTFEASYSNEDDGDSDREPPIVWPDDPTDIPDEGTPTTDLPDEGTPTTDLPDEGTPTTDLPDEGTPTTDLPDEGTPLADVPATGDSTGIWVLAAGVSGLALVWLALTGKKRRDDKA